MKRLKLLGMIAALALVAALAVGLGSPHQPVIEPVRDIEEIWALEDEREESEEPLVTALWCNGVPMPYDAENNVFYCSLGLENGTEWPDMRITAPETLGQKLNLCFSDDYSYDDCDEAIRRGYSYQVMAYTRKQYAYFEIIFTGLPLISIHTDSEISREDTPASVTVSAFGEDGVESDARVHYRGGLTMGQSKSGYKIEYTRYADGRKKTVRQMPLLGETDSIILLPMVFDRTLMCDRLSWDVYGDMTPELTRFSARQSFYTEVFVNGSYQGVYLMLVPFRKKAEINAAGAGHALRDGLYRTCVGYLSDRKQVQNPYREGMAYELHYAPLGQEDEFAPLADYLDWVEEEDDERFLQKAAARVDLNSAIMTQLLFQAGGMSDNVFNNLYIWAEQTSTGWLYHYIPWDMDLSWGKKREDVGENYENWMCYPTVDRWMALDRDARTQTAERWQDMRKTVLDTERLSEKLERYAYELNASGAMAREAECWQNVDYEADGMQILEFIFDRFAAMDAVFDWILQNPDETPVFLTKTNYETKGVAPEL